MKLYILYQTDSYKTTSSKVLFGVFDSEAKAIDAAKENGLYSHNSEIIIEEAVLNQFGEL